MQFIRKTKQIDRQDEDSLKTKVFKVLCDVIPPAYSILFARKFLKVVDDLKRSQIATIEIAETDLSDVYFRHAYQDLLVAFEENEQIISTTSLNLSLFEKKDRIIVNFSLQD